MREVIYFLKANRTHYVDYSNLSLFSLGEHWGLRNEGFCRSTGFEERSLFRIRHTETVQYQLKIVNRVASHKSHIRAYFKVYYQCIGSIFLPEGEYHFGSVSFGIWHILQGCTDLFNAGWAVHLLQQRPYFLHWIRRLAFLCSVFTTGDT